MALIGEGPACTLDATIYDVRLAPDQIGRIDTASLARAATTAESFERALIEMGAGKPLYRANQSVRLAGDSITIGTTTPYVTSSNVTASGNTINTVAYSDVGMVFDVAGKTAPGGIEVDLKIQVSSLAEGTTEISKGVKAQMFRRSVMSHKGIVEANKPFVVVSVDAASLDAGGKAVAYIARVTLGAPQSPGR
jgi:hypothetical protein